MPIANGLRQRLPSEVATALRILGSTFLCAALLLPLLDSHALEGDPYHEHIIVGGSPADQARALAEHLRHFSVPWPQDAPRPLATGCDDYPGNARPRVFAVHGGSAAGSSVIGLGNAAAMEGQLVVPVPPSVRLAVIPSPANPFDVILPVPDPPPRDL